MTSLSSDPDVERFLDNFQQLSSQRENETNNRMSSLEREVEERRKKYGVTSGRRRMGPVVPKKKPALSQSKEGDAIYLLNPKAREEEEEPEEVVEEKSEPKESEADQLARLINSIDIGSKFQVSKAGSKEPKPLTMDELIGKKKKHHRHKSKVKKKKPAVPPKPAEVKEEAKEEVKPMEPSKPVKPPKPANLEPVKSVEPAKPKPALKPKPNMAISSELQAQRGLLRSRSAPREAVKAKSPPVPPKPRFEPSEAAIQKKNLRSPEVKPKPKLEPFEAIVKKGSLSPTREVLKLTPVAPEALVRRGRLNRPKLEPRPEPEVPEALVRRRSLSPTKFAPKPKPEIPEAFVKRGNLSPTKREESRKDEVPEAIARFQTWRNRGAKKESVVEPKPLAAISEVTPSSSEPVTPKKPLSAVLQARQALGIALPGMTRGPLGAPAKSAEESPFKVGTNRGIPLPGMTNTSPVALPGMANAAPVALPGLAKSPSFPLPARQAQRPVQRAKTMDNAQLDKQGQELRHLTKGRARGPKRRLPTGVRKTSRKGPPIRKPSSRVTI